MAKESSAVARSQGELEGVREKKYVTLERLVRDLQDARAVQKKDKEVVDERAEAVIEEMKKHGETTYGWRERDGRLTTVTLMDKETVKVTETKAKGKGSGGGVTAIGDEIKKIGFGRK